VPSSCAAAAIASATSVLSAVDDCSFEIAVDIVQLLSAHCA
jgi:hypothetical protein